MRDPKAVECEREWRRRLQARLDALDAEAAAMHDTQGKDHSASWVALRGLAWVVLGAMGAGVVLALVATWLGWGRS